MYVNKELELEDIVYAYLDCVPYMNKYVSCGKW